MEALQSSHVRERRSRHPIGPVRGREGVAVAPEERAAALLTVLLEQRLSQVVGPGTRGGDYPPLELAGIEVLQPGRVRVYEVVQPHEDGLGHARRVVDAGRVERLPQDRLDPLPVLGVEPVPRHVHEAGEEAPEGVAANEEADPLALAEMEDPHRDLEQLVDGDLEELVTRELLEDLDQRLLVVASRREVGLGQHRVDFPPQHRDLLRARVVGRVRVEAEESLLADDPTVRVDSLHPDVVEVRRAVDGGPRVRLRQVE